MDKNNSKKPPFDSYIKYSGMAFQLFAGILLGVWGGMQLDALWGTKPLLTIILSLLGIAAGMYSVLKDFIKPRKK